MSHLASTIIEAAGSTASPVMHKYVDMHHVQRTSPVSVDHNFGVPTPAPVRAVLPLAACAISFLYQELIKHKLWTARFDRGGEGAHGPAVRSLVSRHLSSPAVDGWNAVAGAVELAGAWALRSNDLPIIVYTAYDLSYETRMRLATCLSVAWKFERQLCSHFPRRFHDTEPNLVSPHTCELAYLGLAFMTDAEREAFGDWNNENSARVRALYRHMMDLEVALLRGVPVFSILTSHAQVQAEARVQKLFEDGELCDEEAMVVRSIVPFFNAVWRNGYSPQPTSGALVCAAMQCVCVVRGVREYRSVDWGDTLHAQFTRRELERARDLLRSALHLKEVPASIVALGCYSDPSWVNYEYMCATTLRSALELAACL